MANLSMSYEVIMIFSTTVGAEGIASLSDKFKTLIAENGTIDKVEEWGERRLAYPINDENEGYYLRIEFTSKPDFPVELNRVFGITDGVLRTLVIRNEEDGKAQPQEEAQTPAAQAEAAVPTPAAPSAAEPQSTEEAPMAKTTEQE